MFKEIDFSFNDFIGTVNSIFSAHCVSFADAVIVTACCLCYVSEDLLVGHMGIPYTHSESVFGLLRILPQRGCLQGVKLAKPDGTTLTVYRPTINAYKTANSLLDEKHQRDPYGYTSKYVDHDYFRALSIIDFILRNGLTGASITYEPVFETSPDTRGTSSGSVRPDAIIYHPAINRVYVEIDMGTEPIARSNGSQTSLVGKVASYDMYEYLTNGFLGLRDDNILWISFKKHRPARKHITRTAERLVGKIYQTYCFNIGRQITNDEYQTLSGKYRERNIRNPQYRKMSVEYTKEELLFFEISDFFIKEEDKRVAKLRNRRRVSLRNKAAKSDGDKEIYYAHLEEEWRRESERDIWEEHEWERKTDE